MQLLLFLAKDGYSGQSWLAFYVQAFLQFPA
jgi:hypothetical protein